MKQIRSKSDISMTKYMKRQFDTAFTTGCEMWTGEDGMLISLAIVRRDDWSEVLQREHEHLFHAEKFDQSRGAPKYAYRARPEESDDFRGCRKLWRICDEVTEFPIIEYPLVIPR